MIFSSKSTVSGTQTLIVAANGAGAWQANCLRPPGLNAGRHRVRLRTTNSALSKSSNSK